MCLVAPAENGWKLCAFFPRAAAAEWYWSTDKVFFAAKRDLLLTRTTRTFLSFISLWSFESSMLSSVSCLIIALIHSTSYSSGTRLDRRTQAKKTTWKRIASSSSGAINVKRLPTNRWFSFNIAPAHGEKPSPRRSINREKLLLLLSYYASATFLSPGL